MLSLSRESLGCAVLVAVLSILAAVVGLWEVTPYRLSMDDATTYDPRLPTAPPAVSRPWLLHGITRIVTSSPWGDWITRRLLDANHLSRLVQLAHALYEDPAADGDDDWGHEYGLGEPVMIRLSPDEWAWHETQATKLQQRRLDDGHVVPPFLVNPHPHNKYRTVRDYHQAYVNHQTTPSAVLERLLRFIQTTNDTLRCIQQMDWEGARRAARESTRRYYTTDDPDDQTSRSIWDGVPVLIKSEIAVRDLTLTYGRPLEAGTVVDYDDDVLVARLRAAGAVVVGTTVLHERGVQPTGYNPHYGGPSNPYETKKTRLLPGGSSSGSAVAVATGMTPLAIGFDGGGSIRTPASFCGTVGLAVGYGRIAFNGAAVNAFSVLKAGPLTASVQDAADALILLGRPLRPDEGRDTHVYHVKYGGAGVPPPHWTPRWESSSDPNQPPPVVKIGVFRDWVSHRPTGSGKGHDDAVYQLYEKTLERLTSQQDGTRYEIVDFTVPYMREQALAHGILITSLFSFAMAKELFKGTSSRETPFPYQPATQIQIKLGQQVSALELLACLRIQAFAVAQWRKVLSQRAHVILTPTTPMTALVRPPGSDVAGFSDSVLFVQIMRYLWPSNLAGLPALAVPVGADGWGLPVSVQVICTHWHEADCLAVGADIERLSAAERPVPPRDLFLDPLDVSASA